MSSPQLRDEDFSPEFVEQMRQWMERARTTRVPQLLNRLKSLLPEETYAKCEALVEAGEWDGLRDCIEAYVDHRAHLFALAVDEITITVKGDANEFQQRVLEARRSLPLGLNMDVMHYIIHERGVERLKAQDEARCKNDDTK